MTPTKKITPHPDSFVEYLKKIWAYKSLIWVFAMRDLKVKYAQTFLGLGWSILQPATAILVFTFFFGYVLKWETDKIPYPLYVYSGLIGWNFFSYIVNSGGISTFESSNVIKKIYFPKIVLPLSKVVVATSELVINLFLFACLLCFYNVPLSWHIIALPFTCLFTATCGLTIVFWVAAFAYRKKDLLHSLPFIVYFGIWITPVFFSMEIIPANLRFLFDVNPMTSSINLWRWTLLGQGNFSLLWVVAFLGTLLLCMAGIYLYSRKENEFSDYV